MRTTRNITTVQATGSKRLVSYLLNYWPILALCSLAALVLLWRLGESSLVGWDEALYAQISKQIVQSGDWLTLRLGERRFFARPPLFLWSTAILYQLFGISEFWARAASAFSGIILVMITYLIGKIVYGRWVGFFAGVILLTSYQFVTSARFGTTDIMLTLFIFLAFYGYLRLGKSNQKWWYVIWISCVLAFMVKSAGGLVAPAVITLALLLDKRLGATAKSKHFWQGLLLAFVVVAPWHVIMYVQHGQSFIDNYIGLHVMTRSTTALEGHTGDRYYYVWALQHSYFPWFYLVPFALALSIRENIKGQSRSRFLLLVFMLVFGLYTMVQTKIDWYIVPLYPALAILTASTVIQAFRSYESLAFIGLAVSTLVVALVAPLNLGLIFGGIALLVIFLSLATKKLAFPNEPREFLLGGLKVSLRESTREGITTLSAHLVAVVMCVFLVVAGINSVRPLYYNGQSPLAKLARIAGSSSSDGEPLIIFSGLPPQTVLFYSDRPFQMARTRGDLADFTEEHQTKDIILAKDDIGSLSTEYEIHVMVEAKHFVYATIKPKGVPQDQTLAGVADASLVTQEIRYRLPEAGEVFLVWGINWWHRVPEATRPAGTVVKDGLMYTPMVREDDTFVARVQVPSGVTIDYVFQITKTRGGTAIEVWDLNGDQDYHTFAVQGSVAGLQAPPSIVKRVLYKNAQRVHPEGVPQDQTPAGVADASLVTQEIRYRLPEAGEVFLLWGINGRAVVPEATRPAGTVVKDGLMYTPMVREDDTFVARVQVPSGATIDYVLHITKTRGGTAIEVWDLNGDQDYHTFAVQGSVAGLQAPPSIVKRVLHGNAAG